MKHSHRKMSRALVGVVGATLALAVVFWAYNLGKSSATAKIARSSSHDNAAADAGATKQNNSSDARLVAETITTPTTRPASQVVPAVMETPIAAGSPTTRPTEHVEMLAAIGKTPAATPAPAAKSTDTKTISDNAKPADAKLASAIDLGNSTPATAISLADAKAKIDAGRYLDARRGLNAALTSGSLSEADVKATKQMLNQVNGIIVFSTKRFPDDELGGTITVPPGGALAKIANTNDITPDLLMQMNGISDPRRLRAGQPLKIIKGPFNAIVYKKAFTIEIWLGEPNAKGSMYVSSFPVGLGKDDSTPTGVWAVQDKLKNPAYYSPRGEGVIAPDDPKNPLGKFWIALAGTEGQAVGKTSYGIHGTIDPDSIGKQASLGCIRLRNDDIKQVFALLVSGKSTVTVKD